GHKYARQKIYHFHTYIICFKTITARNGNRLMHLGLMLIKVNGIRPPFLNGYFCNVMNGRRLYLPVVLMLLAILAIATFQVFWLVKNFREEKQELTFRSNVLFREALQHL